MDSEHGLWSLVHAPSRHNSEAGAEELLRNNPGKYHEPKGYHEWERATVREKEEKEEDIQIDRETGHREHRDASLRRCTSSSSSPKDIQRGQKDRSERKANRRQKGAFLHSLQ